VTARVAVTGASGFVGRALVPELEARGCVVIPVARVEAGMTAAAVVDELAAAAPDVVVNLATRFIAEHDVDQIPDLIRSNVEFGTMVAEGAVRTDALLVSIDSAWQHYEGKTYDPVSLYAATKQALADITGYYVAARALRQRTVTLFDTYGPGDVRPKLIPGLMAAAATGTAMSMSDGGQLIDLTYVGDVVRGIADVALLPDAPASCVLRTWEPVTIREVVTTMEHAIGYPVPVAWGERPSRPREMRRDWVFGTGLPDWTAAVSLEDGLRRTWEAFTAASG
jgi:nucleoside-diphosphate-sugar epimerase